MGFFDFLKQPDINQGVKQYRATPNALLVDVRTPAEYQAGHIPESRNVALQTIGGIAAVAKSRNTPLYVYCRSGARSRQAVTLLQQMGYTNVTNIGGIAAYSGALE